MKRYITILFVIMQLHVLAQNNKFSANIGLSYTPSLCSNGMGDFKGVKSSYSPLIEFSFGNRDLNAYFRSGERLEVGARFGNGLLFTGVGVIFPIDGSTGNEVFFSELGFLIEINKTFNLTLSTRHGVTIKESLYFVSPINATLFFKLTK